jgi:hypothetical protein
VKKPTRIPLAIWDWQATRKPHCALGFSLYHTQDDETNMLVIATGNSRQFATVLNSRVRVMHNANDLDMGNAGKKPAGTHRGESFIFLL